MALKDIAARRPSTRVEHQVCATCALLNSLPEDEAATLLDLLSDPAVRYNWLADELKADGHPIEWEALARHARGGCSARVKLRTPKPRGR